MSTFFFRRCLLTALFVIPFFAISAVELSAADSDDEKKSSKPVEKISETEHTVLISGKEIPYTARAGTILLKEEEGKPRASFFFVSYTRNNVGDKKSRPLSFAFNGGPGSASVWLHLGALGPKRVEMPQEPLFVPSPGKLVDNEYSLLDVTDLVFIDPVSTGFSRATPGENSHDFHGIENDIESVAEFIRLYTTRNRRWSSPKFLIGESYGATRAAGLAQHLQNRHGMFLNGVAIVSSVISFQTIRFNEGNDLPYILFLPSYTAAAWYHKKLPKELQADLRKTLDEVEEFAQGQYARALFMGDRLDRRERRNVLDKLSKYTGLTKKYLQQTNLRIGAHPFMKELLRTKRRTVGRLDSRYLGIDRNAAVGSVEYDPSSIVVEGPFTSAMNQYLRGELRFESDMVYETLTGKVRPWSWDRYENRYVDVSERLREAMTKNPALKVFVANGYYDLATPYFATEYSFSHLGLDPSLRKNLSMGYYEAGHMMYIHPPELVKLKKDFDSFYEKATSSRN